MTKTLKKTNLKSRFRYWYNNLLIDNKVGLTLLLAIITISFIIILSVPMIIMKQGLDMQTIWDNFATAINAWWPFYEDVNEIGILGTISMVIAAIFGLLITSALIGYISEMISQKFEILRKGNSEVLEEGHIIVIGYDYDNHTLLKELIRSDTNRKILVVDDKDIFDVKENLKTNIEVPKNVKIIYRSIDTTTIAGLKKCAVENSYAIVVQPMDDVKTLKTIMALKKVLQNYRNIGTHIVSAVKNEEFLLNFTNKTDIMFSINNLIARIIAVSNNELGLSKVLISIFSFSESELYLKKIDEYVGMQFGKITFEMNGGTPVGIYRENRFIIAPGENCIIEKDDEILYYAKSQRTTVFLEKNFNEYDMIANNIIDNPKITKDERILVFGYNDKFDFMFKSFGQNVKEVTVTNVSSEEAEKVEKIAMKRQDIKINIYFGKINRDFFSKITKSINHIIILSQSMIDAEQSDVTNMVLYLKLIRYKNEVNAKWTIITELNFDSNRELVTDEYSDDFIVSSNITSIMLSQMVVDYRLKPFFTELLSNDGFNICIEDVSRYALVDEKVANLRVKLLRKGIILIGYIFCNGGVKKYVYNPNRNTNVKFKSGDKLIIIKK